MSRHNREIAKNASVVGGATLVTRILGFLRDMAVAYVLGAGLSADAFYVAFRLPNLLRRLFAEGSMTMAFVPIFTTIRKEQGDNEAFAMSRSALVWLILILLAITGLAILFAKPLTLLIAPGFAEEAGAVEQTATLVRIVFPYIILISGVALCMGILNSMGHFMAPALSPAILNLAIIVGALVGALFHIDIPTALAWSVLVGGLGQWLMQQPYLARYGFQWRGPWSLKNKGVAQMARLMTPTIFSAAIYQLNIVFGTLLASYLQTGSITYLYYADRLVQFPLGVFGAAVGTVALPNLSRLAADNDLKGFAHTLNFSLRFTLFICLPAAAGLIGLCHPVVEVLFGRGAFGAADVTATAQALVAYGVGLPAFACVRSLYSAYFALTDTKTPVLIGAICLVVNIGFGLLLMGPLEHTGLALATSIASWVNVILLVVLLKPKLGPWLAIGRSVAISTLLSLAIGVATAMLVTYAPLRIGLIPFWAALYMLGAKFFRMEEANYFIEFVTKKIKRRKTR
ncbi:murein biosynthesis integral membrane protein MurJ [Desulfovibrio inopinatus]|uniref:murein biosynthesis integral membrane protein MurJ n=1 Tax=Desulfovibrio inopinatus TaxID=102109 RepID=UPI00041F2EB2|nr:murein biosynthesis integral membrane protein MurJ [Desulfovibrio inopinatus]